MKQEFYRGRLSLDKDRLSPYWYVTFEGADGRRRRRSTKVPVKGGLVDGVRVTARLARQEAYQRGVQIAIASEMEYEAENNTTVREWCDSFISQHSRCISERSANNARTAYKFFYAYLGKRADQPIRFITKQDAKGFVLHRRESVRNKTVAKDVTALSQAFREAVEAEVISKNPFAGLSIPQDRAGEKLHKEAFSMEEIRYMIDKFPPVWSSAVRCSFETWGQRLGDILRLDWSQFDWVNRVVNFVTGKTARRLRQPMREGFYQWAHARWQEEGCPATGLLHGSLLALGDGASFQFGLLLRTHGIGVLQGSYGGRRRIMNSKTFHSIRATVATELHASGVSTSMAMELVGHESQEVHSVYLRPTTQQLANAVSGIAAL